MRRYTLAYTNGLGEAPFPTIHAEFGPSSVNSGEVAALLLVVDADDGDVSSGKSQNFCLQAGQGDSSPRIIFLAK
jgi:hypothetical protein